MASMQIEIKAEDVERMVRDELVKAGLGKVIVDTIAKTLTGYNSPVEDAIKRYVGEVAGRMLREMFEPLIVDSVTAALKAKVTSDFVDKVVAAATDKMVRAADERY